jgi:hypothetical protein
MVRVLKQRRSGLAALEQLDDARKGLDPLTARSVEEITEGSFRVLLPACDSYEGKNLLVKAQEVAAAVRELGEHRHRIVREGQTTGDTRMNQGIRPTRR